MCSEVTTQLPPPVLLSLSAWLGTRVWVSPIFWAVCWGPPFLCQTTGLEVGAGLRVTGVGTRTELLGAAPQRCPSAGPHAHPVMGAHRHPIFQMRNETQAAESLPLLWAVGPGTFCLLRG